MIDFSVRTSPEWDSFINRFDCPACGQGLVLVAVTATIECVMELTHPPELVTLGLDPPDLVHKGFRFLINAFDRCPACMGEFRKTYHIEDNEQKALLNLIATVVTKNG